MKKFILTTIALFVCGQSILLAQESKPDSLQSLLSEKDILTRIELNTNSEDCYKLYPTKNMWTFLKLDTRTGKIWQVQYSTQGYEYRFQTILNNYDLSYETNTKPNRFELYPTENTYNFILLDKKDGRVWQVQWSQDEDTRMILPIY